MKYLAAIAVVAGLGVSAVTARDQQGRGANASMSDPIAMLRSAPIGRPGEPFTLLEKTPDEFPKELVPEGATFAAAAASASATVVVSAVKAGVPFDPFRFRWRLEDAGWMSPTPLQTGFTMSGQYGSGRMSATYCRGGDWVTLTHGVMANGDQLVRISLGKEPQRSCAPLGMMRSFSDVPIPVLELPAGVRMNGSSGGGGVDETDTRARLYTTMSVAALATDLVAQLKTAGWKIESGPTDDGVMSVTRLTVKSRAGDPVTGQLVLTTFEGLGSIDALFRAVRNKPVIRH